MAKIQVNTVKMTADVEVINVNSYLVANVVRAHDCIDSILERVKCPRTEYNKETGKTEPVLDENGNPTFSYYCNGDEIQLVEERVYPLLKEIMSAFGIGQPPL